MNLKKAARTPEEDQLYEWINALFDAPGKPSPLLQTCLKHLKDRIREVAASLNRGVKLKPSDFASSAQTSGDRSHMDWKFYLDRPRDEVEGELNRLKKRLITPTMAKAGWGAEGAARWPSAAAALVSANVIRYSEERCCVWVSVWLQLPTGAAWTELVGAGINLPKRGSWVLRDGSILTLEPDRPTYRILTLEPAFAAYEPAGSWRVNAPGTRSWVISAESAEGAALLEAGASSSASFTSLYTLAERLGLAYREDGTRAGPNQTQQWTSLYGERCVKLLSQMDARVRDALVKSNRDVLDWDKRPMMDNWETINGSGNIVRFYTTGADHDRRRYSHTLRDQALRLLAGFKLEGNILDEANLRSQEALLIAAFAPFMD